jgi:hypothetical protein
MIGGLFQDILKNKFPLVVCIKACPEVVDYKFDLWHTIHEHVLSEDKVQAIQEAWLGINL